MKTLLSLYHIHIKQIYSNPARHQSHLSREAVSACVLFVLEDNVWVVIGHKFVETLRIACDLALCSPTGPQVVLG